MVDDYQVELIEWSKDFQEEIKEVYTMLKDQENKIFDLSFYDTFKTDIMGYTEDAIRNNMVFVIKKDNDICGFFMFEDPRYYKDIILSVNTHCAVRKKYWGRQSREVCKAMDDYLTNNMRIKRLVASIPQHGYGVIKLLKDIGFKHEGTQKKALIFEDKYGKEKYYDELIYTKIREDL